MVESSEKKDYSKDDYHEIWIPLIDIYRDGETEVFEKTARKSYNSHNEKNLIVFPSEFRHDLIPHRDPKDRAPQLWVPGISALEYLADKNVIHSSDEFTIFEINPGLDVCYLKSSDLQNENLVNKVKSLFNKPPTILTTNQAELLNYRALGISAEKPRDFILVDEDIVNRGRIAGSDELLAKLYESPSKSVDLEEAMRILDQELFFHQFIEFDNKQGTFYAKVTADFKQNREKTEIVDWDNSRVEIVNIQKDLTYRIGEHHPKSLSNISPLRIEQYLAVQHGLLDSNVLLAFICGGYGSGKTLLAYSTALDLVLSHPDEIRKKRGHKNPEKKEGFYKRIAVFRPNDPIGGQRRDEGALPGELWDKTRFQFGGFVSAHEEGCKINFPFEEMIRHPDYDTRFGPKRKENLKIGEGYLPVKNEAIKLYSFADLQGSNFDDTIVIVDESQNFEKDEMKAILSRPSKNTKIIVLGDPKQVYNPRCSQNRNGLTIAIQHCITSPHTFLFNLRVNNRNPISRLVESLR